MIDNRRIFKFCNRLQAEADAMMDSVTELRSEAESEFANPWKIRKAEVEVARRLDKLNSITSRLWMEIFNSKPSDYRYGSKEGRL